MFKILPIIALLFISACKKEDSKSEAKKTWKAQSPIEELGYQLYFDKRLSADNSISCNTCHDVTHQKGGVDGLATSTGINGQKGERNAPTVWNATFLSAQFWDGRAKDLADQAKGPITNPIEMGMESHDATIEKIKVVQGYQDAFKKAFPDEENPINIENLAKAIAAFESTLTTINSPFDQFKIGKKDALNEMQKKGYENFKSIGCTSCHSGDHFAGPEMPLGNGFFMKFPSFPNAEIEAKYEFTKDPGRFEVTKAEHDRNMWRVPTLRNVALTAPYFHNGKVKTLEEAVIIMGKLQLNKDLTEEQVKSLVAFLGSLTGKLPLIEEPKAYN